MYIDSFANVQNWLQNNKSKRQISITRRNISEISGWIYDPSQSLKHESGKFFSVKGLRLSAPNLNDKFIETPILLQPDIGILGFLHTFIKDNHYFLFQAKFEPGNPGLIQLAPTVQSTVSNYSQVHGGKLTPYVEHFFSENLNQGHYNSVVQSETASRFFKKSNNNIIKSVSFKDIELLDNYVWINALVIGKLLKTNDLLNMNARSVLSLAIPHNQSNASKSKIIPALMHKINYGIVNREVIPLAECRDWNCGTDTIRRQKGGGFTIFGLDIVADREISKWSQPILQNTNVGLIDLLVCHHKGEEKFLINLYTEIGSRDGLTLKPTLMRLDPWLIFQSEFKNVPYIDDSELIWSVVHSEEGGRFYQSRCIYNLRRCRKQDINFSENYMWLTLEELLELNSSPNLLNSELRTFISMLRFSA